jgi:hypothetical protein
VIFLDDLITSPEKATTSLSNALGINLTEKPWVKKNASVLMEDRLSLQQDVLEQLVQLFSSDWSRTCDLFGRSPEEFSA